MSALSAGALRVIVDRVKGGGRASPTLTRLGLFYPVRQKVAIATLCVNNSMIMTTR